LGTKNCRASIARLRAAHHATAFARAARGVFETRRMRQASAPSGMYAIALSATSNSSSTFGRRKTASASGAGMRRGRNGYRLA
jgi:hypothetical protein